MFKYQYIYGPVYSWRLGRSLGVDPLSGKSKICNMDCIYCQLGRTAGMSFERKDYVPACAIIDEIKTVPLHFVDYITFSGRGEPTLAKNLGEIIRAVKKFRREKIAVITNGLQLTDKDAVSDLMEADFVLIKLDAANQAALENIDGTRADFDLLIQGILAFRGRFRGKMALQIMVLKENLNQMEHIARLTRLLGPQEIQLNTPLRPSGALPVTRAQMDEARRHFSGLNVVTVFDKPGQNYVPMDEASTISRHGNYRKTRSHI